MEENGRRFFASFLNSIAPVVSLLSPPLKPDARHLIDALVMLTISSVMRPSGVTRVLPARAPASSISSRRPARATVLVRRAAPGEAAPEHFEPAELKVGECLLEDARYVAS